nr:MAG TPA: hypothetical protein [Caudoviricetes sp.]
MLVNSVIRTSESNHFIWPGLLCFPVSISFQNNDFE